MAEETTFFNSDGIVVTNARFIVDAQTFAMRGINSVEGVEIPPSYVGPIILGLIALIMAVGLFTGAIAVGIIGVILLGAAIWVGIRRKTNYTVVLKTSGGEVTAFQSNDRDHIAKIIRALNEAIISQG